jgi:molybdate-binding protein/DNA-binding transcriptional regulator YhcF (GntR family)
VYNRISVSIQFIHRQKMNQTFLYHQIAEAIREQILREALKPGDRLPSVREMAGQWACTIGTVQRAYEELARQGLAVTRPGQGTHVTRAAALLVEESVPLRRATLVNRTEAFLLEALTAGYTQAEVEQALHLALDRWRTLKQVASDRPESGFHFVGSHDPAVTLIASHFSGVAPAYIPHLTFAGSLGGLIALAEGEADLAGTHLWDEESDTYNMPFVRRLLPGRRVALLTLAHRYLGLVVSPSNPLGITGLADLTRPEARFINRQAGAGTRVWLDAQLRRSGIDPHQISGYAEEVQTHSEVARAIAENRAAVGLAVQAAALAYGLDFLPLTTERYDLVIPAEVWEHPPIQALVHWLATAEARQRIAALGGYEVRETGQVAWLTG